MNCTQQLRVRRARSANDELLVVRNLLVETAAIMGIGMVEDGAREDDKNQ